MVNGCQRVVSSMGNMQYAMDTFHTPSASDGICKHCELYNSELDKEGYCLRDDDSGDLDCWRQRIVSALIAGRARRLPSGQVIWLKESFSTK